MRIRRASATPDNSTHISLRSLAGSIGSMGISAARASVRARNSKSSTSCVMRSASSKILARGIAVGFERTSAPQRRLGAGADHCERRPEFVRCVGGELESVCTAPSRTPQHGIPYFGQTLQFVPGLRGTQPQRAGCQCRSCGPPRLCHRPVSSARPLSPRTPGAGNGNHHRYQAEKQEPQKIKCVVDRSENALSLQLRNASSPMLNCLRT